MKKYIAFLFAFVMLLSLCACGADKGEASVQSVSMICGLGSVGHVDRFSGVVSPLSETKINAAENSTVKEIKVSTGDAVTKGQVLFTYDTEQLQIDLERKLLELEKLKATLESQKEERDETILMRDTSTGSEQRQYALDVRELDAGILDTNYNISLAGKEIEKLQNLLTTSAVTSPVDGSVQAVNPDGGYDNNGNPLPLITLVETDGFRVKGYVNEANISSIYEGMTVILRSRVDDGIWHGSILSIDFNNPASNSNDMYYYGGGTDETTTSSKYPFYVTIDSSEGLLLGQHVYIEPDYGQDSADDTTIRLPEWYINDADTNPWVWAQAKNGKLEKRTLKLGDYDADMGTYVVESGLSAEDYIAFPDETLSAGMTCVAYDEDSFGGDMMGMDGEIYSDESIPDGESYEDMMPVEEETAEPAVEG